MATQEELMKGIQDLDSLIKSQNLAKAQITQGGNSSVTEFAGSEHSDQSIPTPAPNGTNYDPSQDIAHKAVEQMTVKELEAYVAYRKSGRPNLQAAILEIEALEGVKKSLCQSCSGQGCGQCGSAGVAFSYANDSIGKAAMAIADKWCCGPNNNPDLNKAQNTNSGGAEGETDPTPTTIDPVIPVATDSTGTMVGKGGEEDEEEGADMAFGKSIVEGLQLTMKGLQQVMVEQKEMYALLSAQAGLTQTIGKSISQGIQPSPQAARAPVSAGAPGSGLAIQPISKGVVPNGQDLGGGAGATQPEGEPAQYTQEDWRSMTKSAGELVYHGQLDPMTVIRMESDVMPDEKTLNYIQAYQRGEVTLPQQQQQGWNQQGQPWA